MMMRVFQGLRNRDIFNYERDKRNTVERQETLSALGQFVICVQSEKPTYGHHHLFNKFQQSKR
jgi:hypothetical protein